MSCKIYTFAAIILCGCVAHGTATAAASDNNVWWHEMRETKASSAIATKRTNTYETTYTIINLIGSLTFYYSIFMWRCDFFFCCCFIFLNFTCNFNWAIKFEAIIFFFFFHFNSNSFFRPGFSRCSIPKILSYKINIILLFIEVKNNKQTNREDTNNNTFSNKFECNKM